MALLQNVESRYGGKVRYIRRNFGFGHSHIVNGEKKVGVTTITGQFEKAGLPMWSANLAAETAIELKNLGILSDKEIYNQARFKHIEVRDDAAAGGTEAHDWIENYLKGTLESVHCFESENSTGIIEAFLQWEADYEPTNHIAEKNLISIDHDYCGTRDDRPVINGMITTLDFKTANPDTEYNERKDPRTKRSIGYTGKIKARSTHFMQDAGYDIADGEETGEYSEAYAVLYLPKKPEEFCKKIGIPTQRYFYFVTTDVEYWKQRFLVARAYEALCRQEYDKHQFQAYINSTQLALETANA